VRLVGLVENELLKLVRRGRLALVSLLLFLFISISVWGQHRQEQNRIQNNSNLDFRARTEQRMSELSRQAKERRIFVGFTRFLSFEIERLRYHLALDLDPERRTGPVFVRGFALFGTGLFFPMLVVVLGADVMSSEFALGTVKLLLTRPVRRATIVLSKFLAVAISATLLLLLAAGLAWLIGGAVFGWSGFGAPVITGFRFSESGVDVRGVRVAPLWMDTLATFGLAWAATLTVASVAVLASVVFHGATSAMGSLMALLVAGSLLGQLAEDWAPAKYLFVTCLPIAQYHSGVPPPVAGMSVSWCLGVLALASALSLVLGMLVLERRDVE